MLVDKHRDSTVVTHPFKVSGQSTLERIMLLMVASR
jgi:hypothetical protein